MFTRNFIDLERFWEVHPVFEQKKYAFLNFYEVDEEKKDAFEKNVRCLTRYLQTQRGYGTTRLFRLDNKLADRYNYVGIQTWFSPDLMKRAVDNSFPQKMISKLYLKNDYNSILYKVVVDDSSYVPN